ncbi:unnamed protein product [Caenorhabditis sp. 36 PRJEB53466]|nr:unnamed protein product [Caenorhabditis sp. 36 PRJEB53466]
MDEKMYRCRSDAIKVESEKDQRIQKGSKNGLHWKCRFSIDESAAPKPEKHVYLSWKFEWDGLKKKKGIEGFEGEIIVYKYVGMNYQPVRFDVELTRSGQLIEKRIGSIHELRTGNNQFWFKFDFELRPVRPEVHRKELADYFKPSELTDAIIRVEGNDLHVNRAFLSVHSEYFREKFMPKFKENAVQTLSVEHVEYEDFARLLATIYPDPVHPTVESSPKLLELAVRFMMPMVTRLVEQFLIRNEEMEMSEKIVLADKFELKQLLDQCLGLLTSQKNVKKFCRGPFYESLSDSTKLKLFAHLLSFP